MNEVAHMLPGWHASQRVRQSPEAEHALERKTRIVAWSIVVLVHALAGAWLLSLRPPLTAAKMGKEDRIEVMFIERESAKPPAPRPAPKAHRRDVAKSIPKPKPVVAEAKLPEPAPEIAAPVESRIEPPTVAAIVEMPTLDVRLEEGTLKVPMPPLPDVKMPVLGDELGSRPITASVVQPKDAEEGAEALPLYPTPVMSPEEKDAAKEGWIWLRVLVSVKGVLMQVEMAPRTRAPEQLVVAAMESLHQWRFQPPLKDGVPVEDWIEIPIRFTSQSTQKAVASLAPGKLAN